MQVLHLHFRNLCIPLLFTTNTPLNQKICILVLGIINLMMHPNRSICISKSKVLGFPLPTF